VNALRLMRRRARAQAGLLALALLLTVLATAAVAGATGYVSIAAQDGVQTGLRTAAPQDAALQVRTRLAADPAVQGRAAAEVLADAFGDLPVDVHRSLTSLPAPGSSGTRELGDVVVGSDGAFTAHATVVDGRWPSPSGSDSAVPTAVQADAAEALALDLGDVVTVTLDGGPVPLEVVATWRATDAADPRWFGDPLVARGEDEAEGTAGPFVVDEDDLARFPGLTLVRWTLVPDLAALTPSEVPALVAALDTAVERLGDDDAVEVQGLVASGGLRDTLRGVDANLAGVRGVTTSAVLVVVLTGLLALSQIARLLTGVRQAETLLLRSRGTSLGQVTGATVLEAVLVTVAGAAIGAGVAAALLRTLGPPPAGPVIAAAAGASVLATAILAGTAGAQAATVTRAGRTDAAGRSVRAVGTGLLGLTALGAVLAWWQLDRYSSPVFTGLDRRPHVDPLATAAVASGLLTIALLTATLLAPVAAAAAGRVQRRSGLMPALTLRQLSRRAPVHAVIAVLVALAAGTGSFVAAYAGAWAEQREATTAAAVGADVRVVLTQPDATVGSGAASYRDLPDVDAAVPGRALVLPVGRDPGELLALPAAAITDVLLAPPGALPGSTDFGALSEHAPSPVPLGAGTTGGAPDTVELTVAATAPAEVGLAARLWVTDAHGELAAVDAGRSERASAELLDGSVSTEHRWTVDLPARSDDDGWQLAALDLVPDAALDGFEVLGVEAGDGTDALSAPDDGWVAVTFTPGGPVEPPVVGSAVRFDDTTGPVLAGTTTRLLPGPTPLTLPVLVTEQWLTDFDFAVGSRTRLNLSGTDVEAVVVGTGAVIPGSRGAGTTGATGADVAATSDPEGPALSGGSPGGGLAALADLATVNRLLLVADDDVTVPSEVWLATSRPEAVAAAVAAQAGEAATVRSTASAPPDPVSAAAVATSWLAAVCALVLAVPGVAAAALALSLSRRSEVAVLRALGVGARQQARSRQAELGGVASAALVLGAGGGLLVAWLCAPSLVRATTRGSALPVGFAVDLTRGGVLLGVTVAVLALVVAAYGTRVRRQVSTATRVDEAS
jgi:hypothetical protein